MRVREMKKKSDMDKEKPLYLMETHMKVNTTLENDMGKALIGNHMIGFRFFVNRQHFNSMRHMFHIGSH